MEESKEKVSMSEEKGKISVIVPVYQAEKYLAKALDSVISQGLRKLGIVSACSKIFGSK